MKTKIEIKSIFGSILFEFEKEMEKHKIIQIKNFITKDKFLKLSTYSFFMKKCKFKDFLDVLDIKKRIKI